LIRSSPLPRDQMDAALAALSVTDQSLIKSLERLRGQVGDYREGAAGLVERDIADERDRPERSESSAE
jgi:hypothetical protein